MVWECVVVAHAAPVVPARVGVQNMLGVGDAAYEERQPQQLLRMGRIASRNKVSRIQRSGVSEVGALVPVSYRGIPID